MFVDSRPYSGRTWDWSIVRPLLKVLIKGPCVFGLALLLTGAHVFFGPLTIPRSALCWVAVKDLCLNCRNMDV